MGKSFEVDDGLLKKIRVAQFQPGKARIVLEVADHSEYTTFLLSDPPRLVIDVHSKDIRSENVPGSDIQAKAVRATDEPDKDAKHPGSRGQENGASKPSAAAEPESQDKEAGKKPASVKSSGQPRGRQENRRRSGR